VSAWRKAALSKEYAAGTAKAAMLVQVQHRLRGWFVRYRSRPAFLEDLDGQNIRSVMIYMHGSGGLVWSNIRFCRVAAGFGCVVIAPDHMSSDEWRARELAPLHTSEDDTGYWQNMLFYKGAKEVKGESLAFSTSVEGVLKEPTRYKELYQRVFEVRAAELDFVLKRLPSCANLWGVTLMGTSEGAMTVTRFNDKPYGKLITARIINAYACEYCYFTPTREAADLGGQKEVPTLNLIGTHDEFFGPTRDGAGSTVGPDWDGSISSKVAEDTSTGWGDPPTGNAFASFVRQGVQMGLVATVVGAQHDATLKGNHAVADIFLSFLAAPHRCAELLDRSWAGIPYLQLTATRRAQVTTGSQKLLWVEVDHRHGIDPTGRYLEYKTQARIWAKHQDVEASRAKRSVVKQILGGVEAALTEAVDTARCASQASAEAAAGGHLLVARPPGVAAAKRPPQPRQRSPQARQGAPGQRPRPPAQRPTSIATGAERKVTASPPTIDEHSLGC